MRFLNKNNIIFYEQFGFRHSHSLTHALIEIIEKFKQNYDSKQYAFGVFLDLQKEFDTVNHDILLRKFNYYGIRGIANNITGSSLIYRVECNLLVSMVTNLHVTFRIWCTTRISFRPSTLYFVH